MKLMQTKQLSCKPFYFTRCDIKLLRPFYFTRLFTKLVTNIYETVVGQAVLLYGVELSLRAWIISVDNDMLQYKDWLFCHKDWLFCHKFYNQKRSKFFNATDLDADEMVYLPFCDKMMLLTRLNTDFNVAIQQFLEIWQVHPLVCL